MMALSPEIVAHFEDPKNVGELPDATHEVEVENPACGDIMRLSARAEEGVIAEVRYKTRGCTASIAAGSVLTEMVAGRSIAEASEVSFESIDTALGGLPAESRHVARLAMAALRELLQQIGEQSSLGQ